MLQKSNAIPNVINGGKSDLKRVVKAQPLHEFQKRVASFLCNGPVPPTNATPLGHKLRAGRCPPVAGQNARKSTADIKSVMSGFTHDDR